MKVSVYLTPKENKTDTCKVEVFYAGSCKYLYVTIKPYKSLFENFNGKGDSYIFFEQYMRA